MTPTLNPLFRAMNPGTQDLADNRKCTNCKRDVDHSRFENDKERKEYEISGFCKDCQDEIFADVSM